MPSRFRVAGQPGEGEAVGLDDDVRGLAVEGIACRVKIFQALKWIGGLQQRPMLAAARAACR